MKEENVEPYDLVIFDEAHKLSADRDRNLRVRKTARYALAETLAGVQTNDKHWQLPWCAYHLLLLTATPHMGKDYPYYALWKLLQPDVLSTPEAFNDYPEEYRKDHFIRRTKEEMVFLDGRPLYPTRISDTLAYELSQGDIGEQTLYDETTEYLRYVYNKAKMLNREAARLAMSVFQRRLASSTYALLRSFERRIDKLNKLIGDIQDGKMTTEQMLVFQARLHEEDLLDTTGADEEGDEEHGEMHEAAEERLMQGVVAASLADLLAEKEQVAKLLDLAKKVHESGHESKFDKLREILESPHYKGEKFIVFTEHRDTLYFLVRRLSGMGYTDQIAQIHGGMPYIAREKEVDRFRASLEKGGARFLLCTDAAGEGINLQFCWIMINYDVPWNPARLEQRMGRIHRYGQKHDPVVILNLVAPTTREGRVLKVLLDKLEKIRKELQSDKVFDCIGRIFQGISIKQYMAMTLANETEDAARELDGLLTKEQVRDLTRKEKNLYGDGGDVARELPRLRDIMDREVYYRLLPGYVRQYVQEAAPLVNIEIEGDMDGIFSLRAGEFGALDPLLPVLEIYPDNARNNFSVLRPADLPSNKWTVQTGDVIWLHPGEPVFECFREMVTRRLSQEGMRGAVFVDPSVREPYVFHMALLSVVRNADPHWPDLDREEILENSLVGIRHGEGADIELCSIEHLLLLKAGTGLPAAAQRLAAAAEDRKTASCAFLTERIAREMAMKHKQNLLDGMPERLDFICRGFDYRESELATARAKHAPKARNGNRKAMEALDEIKRQQRALSARRKYAVDIMRREPELIVPGPVRFIAHALAVPSMDPADIEQHDAHVETIAMQIARAYEEAADAQAIDVHTPELARRAGLPDHPGFDMLSIRPGGEKRAIEIKGRAAAGDIEVSANEWAKACNMRDKYWLYAVYDCATPMPRLIRVRDPFGHLLAKAKGSVLIGHSAVADAGEQ